MKLSEVSPNTLNGSFSKDLVLSKIWLIKELSYLQDTYSTIYVLGSWFGNLAMLMAARDLNFDRIINIDLDGDALAASNNIIKKLDLDDRVFNHKANVNEVIYSGLDASGLVVNTSCNNISGSIWFDNIPPGTMVALQGRNHDPGAIISFDDLSDLIDRYPMSQCLFKGRLTLKDKDSTYCRYMVIGKI